MKEKYPIPLLYPRYLPKNYTWRTLAFYRPGMLTLENGREIHVSDFEQLLSLAFAYNLLIFVDSFTELWMYDDIVTRDNCVKHGRVSCSPPPELKALACCFRGPRNSTRWLISCQSWGFGCVGPDMLRILRECFDMCKVGTPLSPGSLGQEIMKRIWGELYPGGEWRESKDGKKYWYPYWKDHRHQRPGQHIVDWIRKHSVGARADQWASPSETVTECYEIDGKNFYLHTYELGMPTGPVFSVDSSCLSDCETYFVECEITIHFQLHIGPFPMKVGEDDRTCRNVYPTRPGTYKTTAWKEEIEQSLKKGCTVKIGSGIGWKEITYDFKRYVEEMSRLRDKASPEVAAIIKKVIVAAHGRFGIQETSWYLSEQEEEGGYALPNHDGLALRIFANPHEDLRPKNMPHWFYYAIAKGRCLLFEAMDHYTAEELLSSNTDAFYVRYVKDYGYQLQEMARTGDWKIKALHGIPGKPTFPSARTVVTLEKNTGRK